MLNDEMKTLPAIREQLIAYLSKEIETHSNHLMTSRSRIGFVLLVGPSLLMSSFLIATSANYTIGVDPKNETTR